MEYEMLPAVVTSITALLVAFGGGMKWMLARQDKHDERERAWQNEERTKLELQFTQQIAAMEQRLTNQDEEISRMRTSLTAYLRHVGVLEGLLRANDVDVPPLEGLL